MRCKSFDLRLSVLDVVLVAVGGAGDVLRRVTGEDGSVEGAVTGGHIVEGGKWMVGDIMTF
jgi:hypothetical protein